MCRRTWSRALALALSVLALGLTVVALQTPAWARHGGDLDDARERREEIRLEAEELAGDVDALHGEADAVLLVLEGLDANVAEVERQLKSAESAEAAAETELRAIQTRVEELEAERADMEKLAADAAVDQYIRGPIADQRGSVLNQEPLEWSVRDALYGVVRTNLADVLDQIRLLEEDIDLEKVGAAEALTVAQSERLRVVELAGEATAARNLQASVVGEVRARLDARLAEASALEALDAELAAEIRTGEEALARKAAAAAAASRPTQASFPVASADEIVSVRGLQVNASVAADVEALFAAAEADGLNFGGGGWRSAESQIRLRRQNCGSSEYEIYQVSPDRCRPPTARPGSSMHESGQAIDFTFNGRLIRRRDNEGFRWLAANAADYGFSNLPSEPWHWSVNGR